MKGSKVGSMLLGASLLVLPTVVTAQTWTNVWTDNFDGSTLSGSNWKYDVGGGGWGNNEKQSYRSGTGALCTAPCTTNVPTTNVNISGGNLTIQARKQSADGMAYTSARIKTQGLRSFGPGDAYPVKVSARMSAPVGQGLWPAFWMLGTNISTVPWPGCGEIDIMEHVSNAPNYLGTIHWDVGGYASYSAANKAVSVSAMHEYAIQWDKNAITWRLDGVAAGSANIAGNINSTEEFHRPFFIILNLAVGGDWPGSPNSSTVFPANMKVEWVRYDRG